MILTIKGADFSSANIGTLSTVSIRKVIGNGLTHSIPNFVEKGASVEWMLTLLEDYEFGAYSVTMGDTTIIPTVADGVMTISIASVTAAISISVATTYTGVAEPEDPEVTTYKFTINPTPSDATVVLTASGFTQSGNSITVDAGTSVTWAVSASGYTSQSGTITVNSTQTKSVTLVEASESETLTFCNGEGKVVDSVQDMQFTIGKSIGGGKGHSISSTVGRACSEGYWLRVNGGETMSLNQCLDGKTVYFSTVAVSSNTDTIGNSLQQALQALAWITDPLTFPESIRYVQISLKNDAGTTDFTEEEIALIKNNITVV